MMAGHRKSSTMSSPRLMPRLLGWLSIAGECSSYRIWPSEQYAVSEISGAIPNNYHPSQVEY